MAGGCVSLAAGATAVAADFSLTGRYEGTIACDSTTAGVPWSWGRPVEVDVVQDGDALQIDFRYVDKHEYGAEYALYRGMATQNADGTVASGYFRACGGTFPAEELVRMFPAGTAGDQFSFAADSIWVSSAVPNLPGLTVQSCRWSLRRTSTATPSVRECP